MRTETKQTTSTPKVSSAALSMMNSGSEMTPAEMQEFKTLLLKKRSEILNKADSFKSSSIVEATSGQGDEGDLAVSEVSLSLSLRLQERDTQHLQKIDRALAKIEDRSFGFCEQCEEVLHINRLKARPEATLCISCKEEQESQERVFA